MWQVIRLDEVGSTNDEAKARAAAGENDLAVIARSQTAGRGRRGRTFQSLPGKGLYLSVLFRPKAAPEEVSAVTAWSAVAVCRAIEQVCRGEKGSDIQALGIKWPNDVLAGGKKLCGILTELVGDQVVVGMGVNLTQSEADFGSELADKATSLALLGLRAGPAELEEALLSELDQLKADFPAERGPWLSEYRRRCVTLGREGVLVSPTDERRCTALAVEDDLSLRVRFESGEEMRVTSGEVSVRGLLGYGG